MERLSASRLSREALIAECDRQAKEVLDRLGIIRPPVPENAVSYLGDVAIERMDWKELVGAVHKVDGKWVIGINRNDSIARQRFTLMHEFKHALDGLRTVRDYRQYRPEMPKPLEEHLADRFASQILMPGAWVRAAWRKMPHLGKLAWRFGVSVEAMRVRLAELDLPVDERSHSE
jgi:Zn-dependent peptidase ImmA (M78 family)